MTFEGAFGEPRPSVGAPWTPRRGGHLGNGYGRSFTMEERVVETFDRNLTRLVITHVLLLLVAILAPVAHRTAAAWPGDRRVSVRFVSICRPQAGPRAGVRIS